MLGSWPELRESIHCAQVASVLQIWEGWVPDPLETAASSLQLLKSLKLSGVVLTYNPFSQMYYIISESLLTHTTMCLPL